MSPESPQVSKVQVDPHFFGLLLLGESNLSHSAHGCPWTLCAMQNIGCFESLEGPQIRVWLFPGCCLASPGVAWRLALTEIIGCKCIPVAQPCCLSEFSFFLKGEASSSQPRIQRHACAWPRLHSEARRPKAAHGGSETGLLHVSASGLVSLPWTMLSCLCLPLVPRTQDGTMPTASRRSSSEMRRGRSLRLSGPPWL